MIDISVIDDDLIPHPFYLVAFLSLATVATMMTVFVHPYCAWLYFWSIWCIGIGYNKEERYRPDQRRPG